MPLRVGGSLSRWAQLARTLAVTAAIATASLAMPSTASAQPAGLPPEMAHAGVDEHLDGQLPLDTVFRDHTGKQVTLRSFFDGKRPVVLQFAYHTCPVVCGMITTNLGVGLKDVNWTIGKEFDVITISIDPNESLEKAAAKRTSMINGYARDITKDHGGWHFLVGDEKAIAAVANAAGFQFQYDERQKQWAHPSVVMIVKPDGRMARYLYGLEFPPADLRLGLLEASEGRSITTVEKLILYCYHYDPQGGKYVLVAQRVMQVGGGAIAALLFGGLGMLWLRELRRGKKKHEDPPQGGPRSDGPKSNRNENDGSTPFRQGDAAAARGGVT